MNCVARIKRWFTPDFTPGGGVKPRAQLERELDPTWALLVCQERARRDVESISHEWYEGSMECNLLIPLPTADTVLGPSVASVESPVIPAEEGVPSPTLCVDAPVVKVVDLPVIDPVDLEKLEAIRHRKTNISAADIDKFEVLSRQMLADANPCREIVVWVPTGLPAERDVLPRARGVITIPEVPASAHTFTVKVQEAVRLAQEILASLAKRAMARGTSPSTTAQTLSEATLSGPDFPYQETGAAATWITPGCIAMELRAKFGVCKRTPANLEMGSRVARELLRENCVTCRETTWYTSALAVDLWLTPTVVDLACGRRAADFW
uniref:Replication-associated protein n=1 Tax=Pea enation mosaic virus-2 TaxID=193120 RepID=A0A8G1GM58_PEMV2|nr:replication-associated protein [Pea enation mosaic virus 2]